MVLYLYLISHDKKEIKTHTYIGCAENFLKRLNQHNGLEAGGPRITKRAAGSWKPVIIIKIDDTSSLNSKKLKKEWKQSSRGLESRIKKGIELAVKNKLKIIMPKKSSSDIPIIQFINQRWKDDKADLSLADWEHLMKNF
tara:strand:- start:119 stop:538 length:420 start_codon:yes stop_codon:yes gene_type:complete